VTHLLLVMKRDTTNVGFNRLPKFRAEGSLAGG